MNQLRVFVVDDSVIYRTQIRTALTSIPWVQIVGVASNGKTALDHQEFRKADVVIMDLEMPEMDGLQTLQRMKELGVSIPTILFSASTQRAAEITFQALQQGAFDFIAKPSESSQEAPATRIHNLLKPKLEVLARQSQPTTPQIPTPSARIATAPAGTRSNWDLLKPKAIVIGCSTGGPTLLEKLFSEITGPVRCPILITQHMPPVFTATLAARIERLSGVPCAEAVDGEAVVGGRIYIAPGNFHMSLRGTASEPTIVLDQGPLIQSVRPAVDPLFETAAKIFGNRCLGLVFTGMGRDGLDGARAVRAQGGLIGIQDKESCVVFGMPGAIFEANEYDRILSPEEIIHTLTEKAFELKRKAS